jgi:hypothetical protein
MLLVPGETSNRYKDHAKKYLADERPARVFISSTLLFPCLVPSLLSRVLLPFSPLYISRGSGRQRPVGWCPRRAAVEIRAGVAARMQWRPGGDVRRMRPGPSGGGARGRRPSCWWRISRILAAVATRVLQGRRRRRRGLRCRPLLKSPCKSTPSRAQLPAVDLELMWLPRRYCTSLAASSFMWL